MSRDSSIVCTRMTFRDAWFGAHDSDNHL